MREPLPLLQLRFLDAVTRAPLAAGLAPRAAEDYVRAAGEGDAAFRLGIYRSMHESRLHDLLAEDYPRVRALLGDARFEAVARGYLRAHPSRSYRLSELGANLPAFLSDHPLVDRPDLPDIARLDARRNAVFDAADDPALAHADLARLFALGGDGMVRRVRACALMGTAWDIEAAWVAADHREPVPPSAARALTFVVWRRDHVVRHRTVDRAECTALTALEQGLALSDVCALIASDGAPAERVFDVLSGWAVDGLLTAHPSPGPAVARR